MRHETRTFPSPEPIFAKIIDGSGSIQITAHATAETTVEVRADDDGQAAERAVRETVVEFAANVLTVRSPERHFGSTPALHITIGLPEDSTVSAKSGSADVECRGRLRDLHATSGSGDIRVETVAGDAESKTGSGNIEIGTVRGTARLHSASGDVRVASVALAELNTASGNIELRRVATHVQATTASGNVEIASLSGGAALRAVSGDIQVALEAGLAARLDVSSLSGDVSSELSVSADQPAAGTPVDVAANTVSGDISIRRAAAVPSV